MTLQILFMQIIELPMHFRVEETMFTIQYQTQFADNCYF